MDDLVVWLRAQLDEDERTARAAMNAVSRAPLPGAGQWRYAESGADEGGRYWSITTVAPNDMVPTVEVVGSGMSGGGVHEEALARHIAEHDPARVLREIDAKRAMVDAYAEADAMSRATSENYGAWVNSEPLPHPEEAEGTAEVKDRLKGLHYALRLLALPYADRPGYRDDWRP
ncbi:DUF6221 family protein [Streptomyces tendae]|uniref:DUF6221 family protein n=1 Tax=Streptomyces tendae TaxID=1932 RepID=UPI0037F4FD6D